MLNGPKDFVNDCKQWLDVMTEVFLGSGNVYEFFFFKENSVLEGRGIS